MHPGEDGTFQAAEEHQRGDVCPCVHGGAQEDPAPTDQPGTRVIPGPGLRTAVQHQHRRHHGQVLRRLAEFSRCCVRSNTCTQSSWTWTSTQLWTESWTQLQPRSRSQSWSAVGVMMTPAASLVCVFSTVSRVCDVFYILTFVHKYLKTSFFSNISASSLQINMYNTEKTQTSCPDFHETLNYFSLLLLSGQI